MNDDWLHVPPVDYSYYERLMLNAQELRTQMKAKADAVVADENDELEEAAVGDAVENDAAVVDGENAVDDEIADDALVDDDAVADNIAAVVDDAEVGVAAVAVFVAPFVAEQQMQQQQRPT